MYAGIIDDVIVSAAVINNEFNKEYKNGSMIMTGLTL